MQISRRHLLRIGAGLASAPALSLAQESINAYPTRSVRLVAPYPAGSVFDAVGRRVADALAVRMKVGVVIDNKPGAGGALSANEVLRAVPDGYTLLITVADPLVTTPATMKVSYNPRTDFTPIVKLVRSYPVLMIGTAYQSTSLADFVEEARASKAPLTYGSFGTGSFPQLVLESIASKADIRLSNIPYRGTPQALNDMLAGMITLAFTSPSQAAPYIAQGKARALAIMGPARSPVLPQVPTFVESGFDNFFTRRDSWLGLLGPAKMNPLLVERIRDHAQQVMHDPEMVKWLATLDMSLDSGTSVAKFRSDMDAEVVAVTKFIQDELKVKPQDLNVLQR